MYVTIDNLAFAFDWPSKYRVQTKIDPKRNCITKLQKEKEKEKIH